MERKAAVRGLFYPKTCRETERMIARFEALAKAYLHKKPLPAFTPRAIIVPHAGYIYSGYTANLAYYALSQKRHPKRLIVIGPSHRHYFEGVSTGEYDRFETPCGSLSVDSDYLRKLKKHFPLTFVPQAHLKEHSTEVQMPFIRHYFPKAKVIEIVYGKVDVRQLARLIYALIQDPDNLVVISTDLSHFYPLEKAKQKDNICLNAITRADPALLSRGCEACGLTGLQALLYVAKKAGLKTRILDYRTSADASGDSSRVVGYVSAVAG